MREGVRRRAFKPACVRTTLRPLGIGEMLDRAVTLSVRNFIPFALIWVAFSIPVAVLGYYATSGSQRVLSLILDPLARGQKPPDAETIARLLNATPTHPLLSVLYFAVAVFGAPLATAALMWAMSGLYLEGRAPTFGAAYRAGVRLWPAMLLILLIYIVAGFVGTFVLLLAAIPALLLIALLSVVQAIVAIVVGIALYVVILLAVIAAAVMVGLAYQTSCFTEVVERVGPIRAVLSGFARVFGAAWRRSIVTGLALGACYIGFLVIVLVGQSVSLGVLHSQAVSIALSVVFGLLLQVYVAAVTCLYYFDLRVRSEGLDLQLAIAAAGQPAP
jgi:hypothetical protein